MRISFLIFSLIISLTTLSQESGLFKKPIGFNLGASSTYSLFDNKTSDYIENSWTWEYLDFGIHYSKFFIAVEFSQSGLNIKKTFEIDNEELNESNELKMSRTRLKFGGTFFLNSKYGLEPYGGINFTKYKADYVNLNHSENGYNFGLNIIRQIEISPLYTVGLFIGTSLNTSGLTNLNREFGNYYYSFSLGLKYLNISFMK